MARTLEDAIISETQTFVENLENLNALVVATNKEQTDPLVEKLRRVEQKMSLVYTFFKASAYSNTAMWQDSEGTDQPDTNRPAFT
ncbi:hypothetical protein VTP01DRAFT_3754 [Rhizomucor pusillus]|uniref:uncharacterized protein n=1 Tax=Rhizomucor pusillus TaxID=4840 RepID=UPI0037438F6D